MSDKQKAIVFILLAAFLGGTTSPISKIGISQIPPLGFAFMRFLISGICIMPFILSKSKIKSMVKLAPLSLLSTLNIILFILGLKLTTATIAQLLYAGIPLLTGFFLFILFKEKLTRKKSLGIMLGFIGVSLIIFLPLLEKGQKFSGNLLGNILISFGVISYALYNIYSKEKQNKFSPFIITASFIWTTALVLLPLSLMESNFNVKWLSTLSFTSWFSVIYIAVISTVLIYLLIQYALKHGGTLLASMHFYLIPIFAFIFSFLLLGERLTVGLVIGGSLALLGVYITTKK